MPETRPHIPTITAFILFAVSSSTWAGEAEGAGLLIDKEEITFKEKFYHPDDGCFDLSQILEHPFGFIPLVIPITEPAVGYGAVGSLVFISENESTPDGRRVKPDIAAVGALATENGTEGYFGVHSGQWFDGKLQTLVAAGDISANLDFYGIGSNSRLGPLSYNIDTRFIKLEGRYRIGSSRSMLGLGYTYGEIDTQFKSAALPPDFTFGSTSSTLGGIDLIYSYDSRDNIFTPNKGMLNEAVATFHDPSLGASSTYQKVNLTSFYYRPLNESLVFGIKGTAELSFGEVPFYQRPFIQLRGVPVMRYQGEHIAYTEAELRWKVRNRLSLIGFAGAGVTSSSLHDIDWTDHVVSGGVGIRYEIAKEQGLHMGLDLGFSEEDTAVYVVFGSAWMRP